MKLYGVQLAGDEFHKKIGGGIPAGSIVMIRGEEGSGKSAICQRITYGLLNNRVTTTYISTQLSTVDFLNQMSSMGYRVSQHLISGLILFIPVYPLISEPKTRDNFVEKLINARALFENEVIIIDSLSTLIKSDIDRENSIDLLSFFKRMAGTGKAIIFTMNSGEIKPHLEREFEHVATVLIETRVKEFGGDLKNVMMIRKYNSAVQNYQKIITFRVEPGIGLIVEIASIS